MFKPEDTLFPGGQSYGDFLAEEAAADEARRAKYRDHFAEDSRGRRIIHAGKRTHDSIFRSIAAGAGVGGAIVGLGSMAPMDNNTMGEFLSPSRLASGMPGAVAGAALGAAAAYGLRKKMG